ncbi:hypothetical protein ABPG74_004614 [Tetrahymena malaccensis]
MNFSQFAGFYKESLIQMIYENCQQKNQLYNTIAKLSEAIYKKCQKNASDSQIEDLLGQLKVMVQYANQDISAHIDLALQQVSIAKRVQMRIHPQIKEKNSSVEEEDQDQLPKNQPQRSIIESESEEEDFQKQKNQVAKFQEKIQEEKESTQDEDESYSNDYEQDKLESFKKMQKIFDTVESQNGLKIPQHFRDKLFYLNYQTKGVSFCKMLNKEDIKFIYDLLQIYETQKKVSLIFGVDNRLISKIILQYKKEQGIEIKKIQRNFSNNKQKKCKTTSANQHFSAINQEDDLDEDSSVSQEQVNKEKVFNPFDKDNSKENTVIRKVRFQDLAQAKQDISSKPVNKSSKPEQDKEKPKPQKNQQTDNNQNDANHKPSKQITVKLEDNLNENALSQEQENNTKKQPVKQPHKITNIKDKQKVAQEKEAQPVAKPNLVQKSVKEGDKQESQKTISNQGQKRLVQVNQQKKQNLLQKK